MKKLKRRFGQFKCYLYAKRKTKLVTNNKCEGCAGWSLCMDCKYKS